MPVRQWIECGNLGDDGTVAQVQAWLDLWPDAYVLVSAERVKYLAELRGNIVGGVKIGNTLRRLDDAERWPLLLKCLMGWTAPLAIECETMMEPVWEGKQRINWGVVRDWVEQLGSIPELTWYPGTVRPGPYWFVLSRAHPRVRFTVNEQWAGGQPSWWDSTAACKQVATFPTVPIINIHPGCVDVPRAAELVRVVNDSGGDAMLWTAAGTRIDTMTQLVGAPQ